MDMRVKILLDSNPMYKEYIRYNSYWYKILNRNPELINNFIKEVKEKNKLTTTDKINGAIEKIDMLSKFINIMR